MRLCSVTIFLLVVVWVLGARSAVSETVQAAAEFPAAKGIWVDADTPPAGAVARLGTKRFHAPMATGVAISNQGHILARYDGVGAVEWLPDGRWRAVAAAADADFSGVYAGDGSLVVATGDRVWRASAGAPAGDGITTGCQRSFVQAMSSNGKFAACLSYSGDQTELIVFDAEKGKEHRRLPLTESLSKSEPRIALANDSTVVISGENVLEIHPPKGKVRKVADPGFPFSLQIDESAGLVWWYVEDWDRGGPIFEAARLEDASRVELGFAPAVQLERAFVLSPAGDRVVSRFSDEEGAWLVLTDRKGILKRKWKFPAYLYDARFSPDGRLLAAVGSAGVLLAVNTETGAELARTTEPFADIEQVVFSASGERAAVVRDQRVEVYELPSGKAVVSVPGPEAIMRKLAVALSPNDQHLAVGNHYGLTAVYDTQTGQQICSCHEAPASWLFWEHPETLIAVHIGSLIDDWPAGGSMVVMGADCKVKQRKQWKGGAFIEPARKGNPAALWTDNATEKRPPTLMQQWTLNRRTGFISKKGKAVSLDSLYDDWESFADRKGARAKGEPYWVEETPDGKVTAFYEASQDSSDLSRAWVRCEDIEADRELMSFELPPGTFPHLWVSPNSRWVAVSDRTSALLYPCNPQKDTGREQPFQ